MSALFSLLLFLCIASYGSIKLTTIYEVGQGNVALTVHESTISHQYLYSPYGSQKDLAHPTKPGSTQSYPALLNNTRKPLNIDHNQFGYTGQSADPSTGLMMLGGFRNYAPGIGRFIQPDTYNSFSKQGINNPDAYVDGNPIALLDTSGHNAAAWIASFSSAFVMSTIGGIYMMARNPMGTIEDTGQEMVNIGQETRGAIEDVSAAVNGNAGAAGALAGLALPPPVAEADIALRATATEITETSEMQEIRNTTEILATQPRSAATAGATSETVQALRLEPKTITYFTDSGPRIINYPTGEAALDETLKDFPAITKFGTYDRSYAPGVRHAYFSGTYPPAELEASMDPAELCRNVFGVFCRNKWAGEEVRFEFTLEFPESRFNDVTGFNASTMTPGISTSPDSIFNNPIVQKVREKLMAEPGFMHILNTDNDFSSFFRESNRGGRESSLRMYIKLRL